MTEGAASCAQNRAWLFEAPQGEVKTPWTTPRSDPASCSPVESEGGERGCGRRCGHVGSGGHMWLMTQAAGAHSAGMFRS